MTQRRESSSAVLVALIAVVAIGVLFFVAWRFGPGEANSPAPSVFTVTRTERNGNLETVAATTPTATSTTARRTTVTSKPVHLRVDVRNATTWVKITRLSTGEVIAQKQVEPGGQLGGGELQDRQGFAIETAIPGNVSVAVNGLTFALLGAQGPWIVTADTQAPHVERGKIPPPVSVEQP